jgi:hypothetical protein
LLGFLWFVEQAKIFWTKSWLTSDFSSKRTNHTKAHLMLWSFCGLSQSSKDFLNILCPALCYGAWTGP